MKVTVVPAQVTTVEDRIIGNLGFSQMILLILPVFIGAGIFTILPPVMEPNTYKFIIMGILATVCCILAIRIKGMILAVWFITILRYNLRPKYYLFDKNTTVYREQYDSSQKYTKPAASAPPVKKNVSMPKLDLRDAVRVYATIDDPAAKLRFETTKKGGLYVRLTEIEK